MKAISLWQPWASAMASGQKRNETRSWPTSYRGDLLICSAKRKPTLEECGDEDTLSAALRLPYGFGLCVVELLDCAPTANFVRSADRAKLPLRVLSGPESELGDYTPGRFAWVTGHLRTLKTPIPIRGYQGLWELDAETAAFVAAAVAKLREAAQ